MLKNENHSNGTLVYRMVREYKFQPFYLFRIIWITVFSKGIDVITFTAPLWYSLIILLTRDNFGCGSSREHAPWAILDFGIRIILAPSFADIFYGNCFKNGILPIVISTEIADDFFKKAEKAEGLILSIDLENQKIIDDDMSYHFDIDTFKKYCLLEGLDDIGLTLKYHEDIKHFEKKYYNQYPWLFS